MSKIKSFQNFSSFLNNSVLDFLFYLKEILVSFLIHRSGARWNNTSKQDVPSSVPHSWDVVSVLVSSAFFFFF